MIGGKHGSRINWEDKIYTQEQDLCTVYTALNTELERY